MKIFAARLVLVIMAVTAWLPACDDASDNRRLDVGGELAKEEAEKPDPRAPFILAEHRIDQLMAAIQCSVAVRRLQLAPRQVRRLLEISDQALKIRRRYEGELAALHEHLWHALGRFVDEAIANQGLTSAMQSATSRCTSGEKTLQRTYLQQLDGLSRTARGLLDERQKACLTELPGARRWLRERIAAASKAGAAAQPGSEAQGLEAELRKIDERRSGVTDDLGRLLAEPSFGSLVARLCGESRPATIRSQIDPALAERIRNRITDIILINLINGLYLEPEQLEQLQGMVQELPPVESSGEQRRLEALSLRAGALEEIVAGLFEGKDPSRDTMRVALGRTAETWPAAPAQGKRKYGQATAAVPQAAAVLTDAQKRILSTYEPCLFPPTDLRDPVRAGQVSSNRHALKALELMRQIPEREFRDDPRGVADRLLADIERHAGRFPDCERPAVVDRMLTLARKAREMDEASFALEQNEFAEEWTSMNREKLLWDEFWDRRGGDEGAVNIAVQEYLLNPRIRPWLAARLDQLVNFRRNQDTDLDDIEAAPTCSKGNCAVEPDASGKGTTGIAE